MEKYELLPSPRIQKLHFGVSQTKTNDITSQKLYKFTHLQLKYLILFFLFVVRYMVSGLLAMRHWNDPMGKGSIRQWARIGLDNTDGLLEP